MGLARPGGRGGRQLEIMKITYSAQWAFPLSSLVIMLDYVVDHLIFA